MAKPRLAGAESVTVVADREADIYELLARLPDEKTHVLIRAGQDRLLATATGQRLFAWMDELPIQGSYHLPLAATKKRFGYEGSYVQDGIQGKWLAPTPFFLEVGALEPKPGVEPSSSHLANLVAQQQSQPAKMVLRAAYQNDGPSKWISSKTGIQSIVLPFTVGGTPEANSLFGLFDDTLNRLLKGL